MGGRPRLAHNVGSTHCAEAWSSGGPYLLI